MHEHGSIPARRKARGRRTHMLAGVCLCGVLTIAAGAAHAARGGVAATAHPLATEAAVEIEQVRVELRESLTQDQWVKLILDEFVE